MGKPRRGHQAHRRPKPGEKILLTFIRESTGSELNIVSEDPWEKVPGFELFAIQWHYDGSKDQDTGGGSGEVPD